MSWTAKWTGIVECWRWHGCLTAMAMRRTSNQITEDWKSVPFYRYFGSCASNFEGNTTQSNKYTVGSPTAAATQSPVESTFSIHACPTDKTHFTLVYIWHFSQIEQRWKEAVSIEWDARTMSFSFPSDSLTTGSKKTVCSRTWSMAWFPCAHRPPPTGSPSRSEY